MEGPGVLTNKSQLYVVLSVFCSIAPYVFTQCLKVLDAVGLLRNSL